jgi:N-acetylglucosamine kinase-like BadF-type ATPase
MKKQKKNIFYLGVEGGATKGTAVLVGEDGKVVAEHQGRALNYHAIGVKTAQKNLKELLAPLLKKIARNDMLYAAFGMAGLDVLEDEKIYMGIVRKIIPSKTKFTVVNDAKVALEARCPDWENRILVISGTGANVYGESKNKTVRTIGWDFILGDEGSGYDIGLKILKAAMQSFDKRGKKTVLEKLVAEKTNTVNMLGAFSKVYRGIDQGNLKHYIASFSPLLDAALEHRDGVALQIRKEILESLVLGTTTVIQRLGMEKKSFCVGLMGSQWKIPGLKSSFQETITRKYLKVEFTHSHELGVWGAVKLAKKLKV